MADIDTAAILRDAALVGEHASWLVDYEAQDVHGGGPSDLALAMLRLCVDARRLAEGGDRLRARLAEVEAERDKFNRDVGEAMILVADLNDGRHRLRAQLAEVEAERDRLATDGARHVNSLLGARRRLAEVQAERDQWKAEFDQKDGVLVMANNTTKRLMDRLAAVEAARDRMTALFEQEDHEWFVERVNLDARMFQAIRRAEAAEARLAEVEALHFATTGTLSIGGIVTNCGGCSHSWPCPTARAAARGEGGQPAEDDPPCPCAVHEWCGDCDDTCPCYPSVEGNQPAEEAR